MEQQQKKSCGGIWVKTAKSGTKYLSISLEIEGKRYSLVGFKREKLSENHPDFSLQMSEPLKPKKEQQKQEDDLPF